ASIAIPCIAYSKPVYAGALQCRGETVIYPCRPGKAPPLLLESRLIEILARGYRGEKYGKMSDSKDATERQADPDFAGRPPLVGSVISRWFF
ncbi:MAG: hypothetical protein PVF59_04265, partial [Desulfobacterales bacterium]